MIPNSSMTSAYAVTLPSVFSDGCVLNKTAKVWGFTKPRQFVKASFLGKIYEAAADDMGRFTFSFEAEEFGGPHTLTIEDKTINDVHIGRVWFCGGQSNMEGPISRTRFLLGKHIEDDPRIHIFQAEKGLNFQKPQKDVKGNWNTATGEFLDDMYAVPYFFARNLLENLADDVAVGLVCTPAGGTPIEGWLPEELVRDYPEIHDKLTPVKALDYVETVTPEAEKRVEQWHVSLDDKDRGIRDAWHQPACDDSAWGSYALLDAANLPEYGSVWFRRKFSLPKFEGTATLRLGRFEDSVRVYVNGTEVIHVGYQYPPCTCEIPEGVLIEGENIIAVRVVGSYAKPKVVPGKDYELIYPNGRVNFMQGKWKRETGAAMSQKCPPGAWFYGHPCGVYNFMLAPLLGYSVDGFLWYQGESNTGSPHSYKSLFTTFVKHIRKHFGESLPVIFTQLANYIDPHSYHLAGGFGSPGAYWAVLREQQRRCLEITNTAMAVAIDCGEYNDLHPADKKSVGDRLALHARRMVYGEDLVSDGPIVDRVEYIKDEQRVTVHFKHGEGLWIKGGHPMVVILCKDGNIHRIFSMVKDNTLTTIIGNLVPRVIRFGWADCPSVPVYNAYGLPTSPFEEVIKT